MTIFQVPLAIRLAKCIGGLHFQVAERTLLLWNSERFATLVLEHPDHRAVMLPILFPALYTNQESHWHESIRVFSQRVLEQYAEVDSDLVWAYKTEFETRLAAEEAAAKTGGAGALRRESGTPAPGSPAATAVNPLSGSATPPASATAAAAASGDRSGFATPSTTAAAAAAGGAAPTSASRGAGSLLSPVRVGGGGGGTPGSGSSMLSPPVGAGGTPSGGGTPSTAMGLHALGVSPTTAAALIHAHKAPAVRSSAGFGTMSNPDLLPLPASATAAAAGAGGPAGIGGSGVTSPTGAGDHGSGASTPVGSHSPHSGPTSSGSGGVGSGGGGGGGAAMASEGMMAFGGGLSMGGRRDKRHLPLPMALPTSESAEGGKGGVGGGGRGGGGGDDGDD